MMTYENGTPVYEVVIEESRMVTIKTVKKILGGTEADAIKEAQRYTNARWWKFERISDEYNIGAVIEKMKPLTDNKKSTPRIPVLFQFRTRKNSSGNWSGWCECSEECFLETENDIKIDCSEVYEVRKLYAD